MIKINLLPVREERRKLGARQEKILYLLVLVLVFIGIFYWHTSTSKKIKNLRLEITKADQEINRLSKVVKEVEKFKKDKKVLEEKIRVIQHLKSNRQAQVHYLDEINKALPVQVWLEFYQERRGNVIIRGKSLSTDGIADFMRNLDSSSYFDEVELELTTQKNSSVGDRKFRINDFSLRLKTVGSGDAI